MAHNKFGEDGTSTLGVLGNMPKGKYIIDPYEKPNWGKKFV